MFVARRDDMLSKF